MKPFLRWAGGKSKIINQLCNFIPTEFNNYWEPFLGSGALFFKIEPKTALLSDKNMDLINCYQMIKDYPEQIFNLLMIHKQNNCKEYYYDIRSTYNSSCLSVEQAARFLYINKSNFNGIFRVNKKGEYNVPYGCKYNLTIPTLVEFMEISRLLSKTEILYGDYTNVLLSTKPMSYDFIYMDPPYPPLDGNNGFTHYTSERFYINDQMKVAEIANQLKENKCFVMISNSDQEFIRSIYKGWFIFNLPVRRWISANGTRKQVTELVITNYQPKILNSY